MNKKTDVIGVASFILAIFTILLAIFTLIFGDNIYGQVNGHSFFSTPLPSRSEPISKSEPIPTESLTPVPISLPIEITDVKGVIMRLVPAGEFVMGSSLEETEQNFSNCEMETNSRCERSWFVYETPQHLVTLDAYYMDVYEVTNARYAECVTAGVCLTPSQTSSFTRDEYYGLAEFDNYPVIHVSWTDGQTYCEWRDARLPTEAEWEKAARGISGSIYPWGNDPDGTKANFCDLNCPLGWVNQNYNDYYPDTSPVGYYENGKSPYGIYDMAGNVWEWVIDWYDEAYYSNSPSFNPVGPGNGQYHSLRGGSWSNVYSFMHSSLRSLDVPSLAQYGYYGFRCARSVP